MPIARTAREAKVVPSSPLLAVLGSARRAQLPLRGELGRSETEALRVRALDLAQGGWPRLTLDLARVSHWDYRCLPELHRLSQQLRARGGELRLASPSRYLATVLRFGGLDELIAAPEADAGGRASGAREELGA